MEIKKEYEIVGEVAEKREEERIRDYDKLWVSYNGLITEINDMINSVELAGYDNPIDEAYHNALLNVKDAITSNSAPKGTKTNSD